MDGDGSLLMNPSCLVTAGESADLPLVHVVLDDRAYSSTGGQATSSARADLAAWARASGYPSVHRTTERAHFAALLRDPGVVAAVLVALGAGRQEAQSCPKHSPATWSSTSPRAASPASE